MKQSPPAGQNEFVQARFPAPASDIFNYMCSYHISTQQISCVLQLAGRIDFPLLKRAVRLTFELEPILGCRFVEHDVAPYWERRSDLDDIQICTLHETEDVDAQLHDFVTLSVDVRFAPMVQVKVIRAAADLLCVRIFHACSDGAGVKEYVRLLARVYNQLCDDPHVRGELQAFRRRDQHQLFAALGIEDLQSAFDPGKFLPPTCAFPSLPGENLYPAFSLRRLDREQFRELYSYGKKQGATINDLLVTSFYRALFSCMGSSVEQPMTASVTADLRRFLPGGRAETICNLSGMVYLSLQRNEGEPFAQTLKRVSTAMEAAKDPHTLIQTAVSMEMIAAAGFADGFKWLEQQSRQSAEAKLSIPGLTNIGVISKSRLLFGQTVVTDSWIVPPLHYAPHFATAASTYDDVLTLAIGYYESTTKREQIERFLDTMVDELIEASISQKR